MTEENWLDELEKTIDNEQKPRLPVPVRNEDKLIVPLFLLVLIMSVGLVGAYIWKKNHFTLTYALTYATRHQSNAITQSPNSRPRYDYSNYQKEVDKVRADVDKVQAANKKVWDGMKWNTDKIRLMACVNNHNACIFKNNYSKSDLIYINSDWTIDQLPNHLRLNEEDTKWLRERVTENTTRH